MATTDIGLWLIYGPTKPKVTEAKCLDCKVMIKEGCVPYRSLDAFDQDPGDPYCPNCEGDNLQFFETEQARD